MRDRDPDVLTSPSGVYHHNCSIIDPLKEYNEHLISLLIDFLSRFPMKCRVNAMKYVSMHSGAYGFNKICQGRVWWPRRFIAEPTEMVYNSLLLEMLVVKLDAKL